MLSLQSRSCLKQRDVAADLGQTEASISRQVKLMIERGLLRVTVNPRSRREHLTQVTAKGINLTNAALAILEKLHAPIFGKLGDKRARQLDEAFTAIHSQLCTQSHTRPDSPTPIA